MAASNKPTLCLCRPASSSITRRPEYFIRQMVFLFRSLSVLPLWVLQGVGWLGGWLAFVASGAYRQQFLSHARQAHMTRSHWFGAVGAAGKLLFELPRLWFGRPVPVHWDGGQHIDSALARQQGVIFLTPHLL
jgi:Kdo2-lipid IVA lauroyltransferase/acyltransferase